MNHILQDILNLFKRKLIVKEKEDQDVLILGRKRKPNPLRVLSSQPDREVLLINVDDLVPRVNFDKTIAVPVPTTTDYPDSSPNWFYTNTISAKWEPTAVYPVLHLNDILERDLELQLRLTCVTEFNESVNWSVRLVDPNNPFNFLELMSSANVGAAPLETTANHGHLDVAWTKFEREFKDTNTIKKLFFEQYNIKEGILELWIHTSSGLNTMITGAIMSFRSI